MNLRIFDHVVDGFGFIYGIRGNKKSNRPRCILLYVPTNRPSSRSLNNQWYVKITDETGFTFLKENFPDLVFRNKVTEEEYVSVKKDNIVRVFHPVVSLETLIIGRKHPELRAFCAKLNEAGVAQKDIGIIGSTLIGFDLKRFHDYDLVVFGKEYVSVVQKMLRNFESLDTREVSKLAVEVGLKNNPIGYDFIQRVVRRRQRSAINFQRKEFAIKFAMTPHKEKILPMLAPDKEICLEGRVIDDEDSCIPPYSYKVVCDQKVFQVATYSFAFINSSYKNEPVRIFGTKRVGANLVTLDKPYHYIFSTEDL